ncbi:NACHT domain-containing protein [Lentzea sp. NPDC054927]
MPSTDSAVSRIVLELTGQLADELGTTARNYLATPDFAAVVFQARTHPVLHEAARTHLREGLRLAGVPDVSVADAIHRRLITYTDSVDFSADLGFLLAAANRAGLVLQRLTSLAEIHLFTTRLRQQIVALHSDIRLPHTGVGRAVPYDLLYVEPDIDASELGTPRNRTVILGDPGSGKSTFAAKLAHDVASEASGRVPFLIVLRDFQKSLADFSGIPYCLESMCRAPYDIDPPPDAVDYLLATNRAVVVLDGLDELTDLTLRRRVVMQLESFARQHPLVPIVVTTRGHGYRESPLDAEMFRQVTLPAFTEHQVKAYAQRWYALDDSNARSEQYNLTSSFLEDSRHVPELRSNPLLLSLLCAMSSNNRFLARNLAQAYERCAVLLFERWDALRGIATPFKLEGRVRRVLADLAWHLLSAPVFGSLLSHNRIMAFLTDHAAMSSDDHDELVMATTTLLDHCTGRAWLMTDFGSTDTEPLLGFTHRAFLEFLAASHVLRTHDSAAEIWAALRPNVDGWGAMPQIALQLYDRDFTDGIDSLLQLANRDYADRFAANALSHAHLRPALTETITHLCAGRALAVDPDERVSYFPTGELLADDEPLLSCLRDSLAGNVPIVLNALTEFMEQLPGHYQAVQLIRGVLSLPWPDRTALTRLERLCRFAGRLDVARERGPHTYFESWSCLGQSVPALAMEQMYDTTNLPSDQPWISGERWLRDYERARQPLPTTRLGPGLSLPYLEMHVEHGHPLPFEPTQVHLALLDGRRHAKATGSDDLLRAWTSHRFNVFSWQEKA